MSGMTSTSVRWRRFKKFLPAVLLQDDTSGISLHYDVSVRVKNHLMNPIAFPHSRVFPGHPAKKLQEGLPFLLKTAESSVRTRLFLPLVPAAAVRPLRTPPDRLFRRHIRKVPTAAAQILKPLIPQQAIMILPHQQPPRLFRPSPVGMFIPRLGDTVLVYRI